MGLCLQNGEDLVQLRVVKPEVVVSESFESIVALLHVLMEDTVLFFV